MKNSVMFKLYLLALTIGLLILANCALPPEKITPPETTPQTKALELKESGSTAAEVAKVLREKYQLMEIEIGAILENVGFEEDEFIDYKAFEIVKRFAPILKFDRAHKGLPMSAETYFKNVMHPIIKGKNITWTAGWNGPKENRRLGIRCLWGRDECTRGMSNTDFQLLLKGQIPTYFRVISDRQAANRGRLRIVYWWFYGFQEPCNKSKVFHLWKEDGAHHGDWEKIMVTTSPDRSYIEAVTYYFHGNHYTRRTGHFFTIGERPVVFVGKLAHGNYHNQEYSGWGAKTGLECCEYADYRNPVPSSVWKDTDKNLVSLSLDSESWMIAEQNGSKYEYKGKEYKILGKWTWGPHISWCSQWIWNPFGDDCVKWNHVDGCGTHPTMDPLHWAMKSCSDAGCGSSKEPCPESKFDQGWMHDMLKKPAEPAPSRTFYVQANQ
jgi:hypothetical protein